MKKSNRNAKNLAKRVMKTVPLVKVHTAEAP